MPIHNTRLCFLRMSQSSTAQTRLRYSMTNATKIRNAVDGFTQHRYIVSEGDKPPKLHFSSLRDKSFEKPIQLDYLRFILIMPELDFRGRSQTSTCHVTSTHTHWFHIYGFPVLLVFLTFLKNTILPTCIKTLHLCIIITNVEMTNHLNTMHLRITRAIKHFIHYVILLVYKWSFVRSFRYDWDHTAKLERECGRVQGT